MITVKRGINICGKHNTTTLGLCTILANEEAQGLVLDGRLEILLVSAETVGCPGKLLNVGLGGCDHNVPLGFLELGLVGHQCLAHEAIIDLALAGIAVSQCGRHSFTIARLMFDGNGAVLVSVLLIVGNGVQQVEVAETKFALQLCKRIVELALEDDFLVLVHGFHQDFFLACGDFDLLKESAAGYIGIEVLDVVFDAHVLGSFLVCV